MGLGKLLTRSTRYTVTDTVTGASAVYTIVDGLAPDWASSSAYRGAVTVPGAWSASLLISDFLGQVPWHAYRVYGGRDEEMLQPTPLLLEQPNPPDPRMATFSSWGLDLVWHGNAFGVISARNQQNYPTAALPVAAVNVEVRRVTPYQDSPLPVGALEYKIGALQGLSSQDVIHIKGPCEPGAVRGMGVLEAHMNTLNLAQSQQRQAGSISSHGVPTGILKSTAVPDMSDAEAADLKQAWLTSQSTRSVAVLNASTDFTPLSWNPEELQMVEARRFSLNEMELIFRLPVGWLGGTDSSRKYSNMSQDDLHLIKYTMQPHLSRFEQTLSLAFPRGTDVRANLDAPLRADTLTRYQAHRIALGEGVPFLEVDEVREFEHRPPMPEKPIELDPFAGDVVNDEEPTP